MFNKVLNMLAAHGISVVDLSLATNDPMGTGNIDSGYLANITLNIPSTYDTERVLSKMLRAALSEIQSQDHIIETPTA